MQFTIGKETLLRPLQIVIGVVERRQTLPVLSNVLVSRRPNELVLTATDLEVEAQARLPLPGDEEGEITVPARKLFDICKALPDGSELRLELEGDRMRLRGGRSRFTLSTLPAEEFPQIEDIREQSRFSMAAADLRRLMEKTHFCMAQQDVRYYLNGLLLELGTGQVRAVATDGHRLALCEQPLPGLEGAAQQVIVPRKGIQELLRLLQDAEGDAVVALGENHVRVEVDGLRFTSKLIDGRFPDYQRVLPTDAGRVLMADRRALKDALSRTSILSNEKYRGIRFVLEPGLLRVQAHNPEREEAEEELEVEYDGPPFEIGFNVNYLLDALNAIEGESVSLAMRDSNSSALVRDVASEACRYVVMPMRL